MTTLQISLPEPLKSFVEAQAAAGGYGSKEEYVQALIRAAQQREQRAALEAKLLTRVEALERGEGREMTAEDWERLRNRIRTPGSQGNGQ